MGKQRFTPDKKGNGWRTVCFTQLGWFWSPILRIVLKWNDTFVMSGIWNVTNSSYNRDLSRYKRDLQKRLAKETYKRGLPKRPTKETYKRDLQKRPTKETYKRDLQKRPVTNVYYEFSRIRMRQAGHFYSNSYKWLKWMFVTGLMCRSLLYWMSHRLKFLHAARVEASLSHILKFLRAARDKLVTRIKILTYYSKECSWQISFGGVFVLNVTFVKSTRFSPGTFKWTTDQIRNSVSFKSTRAQFQLEWLTCKCVKVKAAFNSIKKAHEMLCV